MPDSPTLESLARAHFGVLTEAETRLVQAAPNAIVAFCGPSTNDDDAKNDPSKADADWKKDRTIRAALIRWICVDRRAKELVDPFGIGIYGAKIDALDLSYVNVPFGLNLWRCRLTDQARLDSASITLEAIS